MARITIEDCMEKVPNRFHLVRMASIRAKQLKKGARPLLTGEENKAVVTSLREIAAGLVKPGDAAADVPAMVAPPSAFGAQPGSGLASEPFASGPAAAPATPEPLAPFGTTSAPAFPASPDAASNDPSDTSSE